MLLAAALVLVAVVVGLLALHFFYFLRETIRMRHIPGLSYPHVAWLFLFDKKNNFFLFPRDQKHLSEQLREKKVWKITLGRESWVFTRDPEVIREICVTKYKDYRRDKNWKKANMVNTRGNVLVSHGEV